MTLLAVSKSTERDVVHFGLTAIDMEGHLAAVGTAEAVDVVIGVQQLSPSQLTVIARDKDATLSGTDASTSSTI
jgi:hypothetical protein